MKLTSETFQPEQPIPVECTCDGEDRSPELAWGEIPVATRSFWLICDDPDAPRGTWVHWAGRHGLHFHAQGTCTPPDFASAGAHFNPGGRKHGRLNPEGLHLGDVPNLVVGPNGSADTSFMVPNELVGTGPSSLLQPGGAALVIHADADDERTDPSGSSGARMACAVIEPG